jgi:hypothetical protein
MQRALIAALLLLCLQPGCTRYQYAKNVKMVSYEDNVIVGKSIGLIRGESCQAQVMGNPISEPATLDKAMTAARADHKIRYVNNMPTETTGFDAFFCAKSCVAIKGTGYE